MMTIPCIRTRTLRVAAGAALLTLAGLAGAQTVSASVSGAIAPGVYGRIDIGNQPPPPLIYSQPVLVSPRVAYSQPVYMYVPPGHARKWSKHCHRYDACNVPVYFVNVDNRGRYVYPQRPVAVEPAPMAVQPTPVMLRPAPQPKRRAPHDNRGRRGDEQR